MIKKLNKADQFGIFQKYSWDNDLSDFAEYNLIYGWNYSGKTILSRIFRCFELNEIHKDYLDGSFEIEDADGKKIDQKKLEQSPAIRVFNSDFIKENFKWDEEEIEPIFMLGEENIQLQANLKENKVKLESKSNEIAQIAQTISEKKDNINHKLTQKAREIRDLLTIYPYTKSHFERNIEAVKDNPQDFSLVPKDFQTYLQKVSSTEKKDTIQEICLTVNNLEDFSEPIEQLLSKTVVAQVIEKLKENKDLSDWVKKGIELHAEKTTCEFCGNELPSGLIENLNKHFSEDYESVIQESDKIINTVEREKISTSLPDEAKLYKELQRDYKTFKNSVEEEIKIYNQEIDNLKNVLENKKSKAFNSLTLSKPNSNHDKLNTETEKINQIIQKHNTKSENYDDEKKEAETKLCLHYASDFVIKEQYFEALQEITDKETELASRQSEQKSIEKNIIKIEAQLSETVKGAEKFNEYLKLYFGRDDVVIKVTPENKFKLYRSKFEAKNLSEGEKTAIAFSYFMAKLDDKETSLNDTVVYIDDPISSLDSNHLFNTYSFIKTKLDNCKQIFISTHNFEFLNLIKDWFYDIQSPEKNKNNPKWSCYLIERNAKNNEEFSSQLVPLPAVILKFKSEYHFLFSIVYQFYSNPKLDEDLYNLPNLVRRYLESFLGFKIPRSAGLNKKLPELIDNEVHRARVWKFINQYSHNSSLPRSLNFPEFDECAEVIKIVVEAVRNKDPEHFDILVEEGKWQKLMTQQ
jgi:wobble nucleotide-excising tRNase